MQYNYWSRFLVVIDGHKYVYKYEIYIFEQTFTSFQAKNFFIGKWKVFKMTEFSGADSSSGFDGNTISLECGDNDNINFSGFEILKFKTDDKIMDYISFMGSNMCLYTIAIGKKYTNFKSIHYKFIEN